MKRLPKLVLIALLGVTPPLSAPAMAGGIVLDLPSLTWPEDMAVPQAEGGAVLGTKSVAKP